MSMIPQTNSLWQIFLKIVKIFMNLTNLNPLLCSKTTLTLMKLFRFLFIIATMHPLAETVNTHWLHCSGLWLSSVCFQSQQIPFCSSFCIIPDISGNCVVLLKFLMLPKLPVLNRTSFRTYNQFLTISLISQNRYARTLMQTLPWCSCLILQILKHMWRKIILNMPTLKDFRHRHPNITSDIFLGDAAFDTIESYKSLFQDFSFKKSFYSFKSKAFYG